MASGVQLVLGFETEYSSNMVLTFNYAKPAPQEEKVKALVNGIIANGSIFANVPAVAKSAKVVTTTEQKYDLSD